jgi:putative aminopeptidase FrvX
LAQSAGDANRLLPSIGCFIDVRTTSRDDYPVRRRYSRLRSPFLDLGGRLAAKAMDDRIGVAILIETLKRLETT